MAKDKKGQDKFDDIKASHAKSVNGFNTVLAGGDFKMPNGIPDFMKTGLKMPGDRLTPKLNKVVVSALVNQMVGCAQNFVDYYGEMELHVDCDENLMACIDKLEDHIYLIKAFREEL